MSIFELVSEFFRRRAVQIINERAKTTRLVRRLVESKIGFVYPGANFVDGIEVAEQSVGYVDYGISPLGDRLYINRIEIQPSRQHQWVGQNVLWLLWIKHGLPIVPLHQYTRTDRFWYRTRRRLATAGAVIHDELKDLADLQMEQQRWAHMMPNAEDKLLMREYWEWVAAEHAAGRPAGPDIR